MAEESLLGKDFSKWWGKWVNFCLVEDDSPPHPTSRGNSVQCFFNFYPDDYICDIAIYADDNSHDAIYDPASYLWKQFQLISEFESGSEILWIRVGRGLLILILEKPSLLHLLFQMILTLMSLSFIKNHLWKFWNCLPTLNWTGFLSLL